MPRTSNSVHFFMSLYLQRMHINYKNQKRQILALLFHTEKPLSMWLIFFPLQWHILVLWVFFKPWTTTKFQLNIVEDFQSNRKSCFQGSISSQKRKKNHKNVIRTVVLPPPLLAQLITGMSLQRNVSKSAGFLLFLSRSGRKKLFKAKEKPCTSVGMHRTRWSKQRKVAITFPAILQESPKRSSDVPTANEALHLSELGCWGGSPQMGLGVKE